MAGFWRKLVLGDGDGEQVVAEAEQITRDAASKRKPKDNKKKREEEDK